MNNISLSRRQNAIPRDVAWQLCAEVRDENGGKWYTFNGLWCLCCEHFCQGDVTKMCVSNSPDYRGCAQVNARYDRRNSGGEA